MDARVISHAGSSGITTSKPSRLHNVHYYYCKERQGGMLIARRDVSTVVDSAVYFSAVAETHQCHDHSPQNCTVTNILNSQLSHYVMPCIYVRSKTQG